MEQHSHNHPPTVTCPLCNRASTPIALAEVNWLGPDVLARLVRQHPRWQLANGACPACVQQVLLQTLLDQGDAALHDAVQAVWPLDAEAAFGAIPTPLRLHADPRFTGKGVTIALIDSGFYPHPDLTQPRNRIRAWADAGLPRVQSTVYGQEATPTWPRWDAGEGRQWHGLMTSTVATGNGWLSHGLYRGLASDADLVLIQVRDEEGYITNETITRALKWVRQYAPLLGIRVVSMSVAGDITHPLSENSVDRAIAELVADGIVVVAAAGNSGQRSLVPPATAPHALTIGGLDDQSMFDHDAIMLWHSNYGESVAGMLKPELVAPSIWVVAPVLPPTPLAQEARQLFERRAQGDVQAERQITANKLVTPYYQHVDGTSFAAPIVASAVACMLEANPALTPVQVRDLLIGSAMPVGDASRERQGAGALDAGRAVAHALRGGHRDLDGAHLGPQVTPEGVTFWLHDHQAGQVQVMGSWNHWQTPGLIASEAEPGVWRVDGLRPPPGVYTYKYLLNGAMWLADPGNPHATPDGYGGLNSLLLIPGG